MINEPIPVTLGVGDEENHMPMTFLLYDEGVSFGDTGTLTKTDLEIAYAVFMDLADAIQAKLQLMVN